MATAFGWLALSVAMLLLITHALRLDDPTAQRDVLTVAAHLDDNLLADFSFMTVYTGLMLAGLTQWGYTRFWWVTVKLALALACALGSRAIFTRLLADATTTGRPIPGGALVLATTFMIVAIAFLAWVARTKPWAGSASDLPLVPGRRRPCGSSSSSPLLPTTSPTCHCRPFPSPSSSATTRSRRHGCTERDRQFSGWRRVGSPQDRFGIHARITSLRTQGGEIHRHRQRTAGRNRSPPPRKIDQGRAWFHARGPRPRGVGRPEGRPTPTPGK